MGVQSRLSATGRGEESHELLPSYEARAGIKDHRQGDPLRRVHRRVKLVKDTIILALLLAFLSLPVALYFDFPFPGKPPAPVPQYIKDGIKQCEIIARPPPSFKPYDAKRTKSDRFVDGTGAVLLKNATLWTGEKDGEEVLYGASILLAGGVIRKIGSEKELLGLAKEIDAEEVELNGAWVTPGKRIYPVAHIELNWRHRRHALPRRSGRCSIFAGKR